MRGPTGSQPRPVECRPVQDRTHHTFARGPRRAQGYLRFSRRDARSRVVPHRYLIRRIAACGLRPVPHASSPRGRPRAGPATFDCGLRLSPGKVRDSEYEGGRPWMGRERGGRATGPARRGTHATGSGGSPASWDSTTGPGTRPRPRRPAPGVPRPREHDVNDQGVSRLDAGPGHPRRRRAPRARGRTPHTFDQGCLPARTPGRPGPARCRAGATR